MSRWLEAARKAENVPSPLPTKPTKPTEPPAAAVSSVFSVLSKGGSAERKSPPRPDPDAFEERAAATEHDGGLPRADAERLASRERGLVSESAAAGHLAAELSDAEKGVGTDADALLAHLRATGPATYGAAARATGMGASRAWRAEARLRAVGLVTLGPFGRACPTEAAAHDAASERTG